MGNMNCCRRKKAPLIEIAERQLNGKILLFPGEVPSDIDGNFIRAERINEIFFPIFSVSGDRSEGPQVACTFKDPIPCIEIDKNRKILSISLDACGNLTVFPREKGFAQANFCKTTTVKRMKPS